ncbi:MAG: LysM peptidoglycan-binding domain-containing protein [Caldilineaceae bacterium]|nr:LysM peptidoglycan-binding domain-containing protein [Caldilineaceae bacterium]MCB0139705.1 LysM peptidoglycan-binding domain-containing protein [Caldilineaceae bacterium]
MQSAQNIAAPSSFTAHRALPVRYASSRVQIALPIAATLLIMLFMLSGCTRNRPTAEPVEVATVTMIETGGESTPAPAQIATDTPPSAEVAPQVASETPTPIQGAAAEPEVAVEQPTPAENPPAEVEPTPIPTLPAPDAFAYTVTAGDTLPAIAALFGVTPEEIRELNFLTTDNIQPGQILRIPRQQDAAAAVENNSSASTVAGDYTYAVQPGDTLNDISLQFDVSAAEIIAANSLSTPDNLLVGQQLVIPGYQSGADESTTPVEEGGQVAYIVQPGDQLYAIAERFGVATADIISANGIQNPGLLRIGQRLIIPGITEQQAAAASGRLHTVQPGEGLGQIAAMYGVTVADIARLNNLGNVEIIYPGQELIIPGN